MTARAYFIKFQRHGRAAIRRTTLRRWWIAEVDGHLVLCYHSPNPDSADPIRFIGDAAEVPESIGQHSDLICVMCRAAACVCYKYPRSVNP